MLAVCELREAKVNYFVHKLIDQHEVCPQKLFLYSPAEIVNSLKTNKKSESFCVCVRVASWAKWALTLTMLSRSSSARDGLRFLFRDETTKYSSRFFMWANCTPLTSCKERIHLISKPNKFFVFRGRRYSANTTICVVSNFNFAHGRKVVCCTFIHGFVNV